MQTRPPFDRLPNFPPLTHSLPFPLTLVWPTGLGTIHSGFVRGWRRPIVSSGSSLQVNFMTFKGMMLSVAILGLFGCVESATRDGRSSAGPASGTANVTPAAATQPSSFGANVDFQETTSGLKYHIINAGGDRKPSVTSTVTCHYRGTLENGTEFDSSYKRGEPTSFPLGGVIPGWTEGLQLIGEGGVIDLVIPGPLAYGPRGIPGTIPPNATLHFHVELVKIQ